MKTNSQEVQELLIEAQRKAWTSKPKILKVTQKKDLDYQLLFESLKTLKIAKDYDSETRSGYRCKKI